MFMTEFDQESLREFDRKEGYDQGYDQGYGQAISQFFEKLRELGVDESLLDAAAGSLSAERG